MTRPIHIDPEHVHVLDSNDFTRLYSELLRAEAGRHGIPQDQVDTTVRDKAPDGGVDCRVSDAGAYSGTWIPSAGSVHQLKGGGSAPSLTDLETELTKSEPIAAFVRGDAYVFSVAQPLTSARKQEFLTKINEEYTNRGLPPRGHVLTAAEIAKWVEEYPAIAARYFALPLQRWYLIEQWERQQQYGNDFIPERARTDVIDRVRSGIVAHERLIHIIGPAGAGKSRTVLEAVRERGVRERVLYATDAANVDPDFFWYLANQNPAGSGVLVIDECTAEELPRIRSLTETLPPSYTVVAIGPLQFGTRGGGAIEIPLLGVDAIAEILGSLVVLPDPVRQAIARRCGGSPKLAVLIGTELARDPSRSASWEEIERSPNIVEYLNNKIFPLGSDDPMAIAMRSVSMFMRLGWRDEVAEEGQAVVTFLGGDWRQVQMAAQRLVQRGVLSPRGRYLYPTPDVLANYLTRETLRAYGAADLRELFAALSEGAQRAFAERLRQLGEEPSTRDVVTEILGDTGFFGELADLNDPRVAGFLHQLVPAFPGLTVRQLQRTIGTAPRDALLGLDVGRRHIVWALEELAWWEEHFPIAAELLLRLAWAENETFANNATGVWKGLFQIPLGGTSAPFATRSRVLDRALGDADPLIRRLGVMGLRSALKTEHIVRFGGPPENTGTLPPTEWNPATNAEWADILRACLQRLTRILDDTDEQVRKEAVRAVADRGSELIRSGLVSEWADVATKLANAPFDLRKPVLDAIGWQLSHGGDIAPDDRTKLEGVEAELLGEAFSDRLRRVVGSWDYELERFGRENAGASLIEGLAREALSNPDHLGTELSWLSGGEANSGWALGRQLGRLDTQDALLELVLGHWHPEIRDDRFLVAYFAGASERHGTEWLEEKLDSWVKEPSRALLVASITWHTLSTDRAARRLRDLITQGLVPASYLRQMVSGFWAEHVSSEALTELIEAASSDASPGAITGRVVLLAQYLDEHSDRLPELLPVVERALEESAGVAVRTMDAYYWAKLARLVLPGNPAGVARLCIVSAIAETKGRHHGLDEETRKVLAEALAVGGWEVFESVIGPALLSNRLLLWTLDDPFRGRTLLRSLDPDRLANWIAEDPVSRLSLVASAVPVVERVKDENQTQGDEQLSPLARALLIQYGDREEVRGGLASTLLTGIWHGPESEQIRKQLAIFDRWGEDPEPNVRAWVLGLAEDHRRRLERVLLEEAEEV